MNIEDMNKNELLKLLEEQPEMLKKILASAPEEICIEILSENKDLAIRAISISPEWYLEFGDELSRDKDVVTALCKNIENCDDKSKLEGHFRGSIKSMEQEDYDKMFADRDFVFTLMDLNGVFFGNASEELRNDSELLLTALEKEDEVVSLSYASDELRNDREIAEKAIDIHIYNYFNISANLKKDRDLCLKVLKLDPEILEFDVDMDELFEDDDFLSDALTQNPKLVEFLSYDKDLQAKAEEMLKLEILPKKEAELSALEAEATRDTTELKDFESKQGQNIGE